MNNFVATLMGYKGDKIFEKSFTIDRKDYVERMADGTINLVYKNFIEIINESYTNRLWIFWNINLMDTFDNVKEKDIEKYLDKYYK